MKIHHTEHHRRYIERLNAVLEARDELRATRGQSVEDLLWNLGKLPDDSRNAIRNFGGGHANHSLFWSILSKDGGGEPSGLLSEAIAEEFGSFAAFRERFTTAPATGGVPSPSEAHPTK